MADDEGLLGLGRAGSPSFSPSFSPSYSRVSDSPNGSARAWASEESVFPTSSVEEGRQGAGGWGGEKRSAAGDGLWDRMFAELVGFKQAHGHTVVQVARRSGSEPSPPASTRGRPSGRALKPHKNRLGTWVQHQRRLFSLGTLSRDRWERLAGLGFQWDVMGGAWERMFAQLVQYHAIHGNTDVSQGAGPHHDLGRWVCTQRYFRRKGRLRRDREARLALLGLRWDERQTWEESLRQLMLFRQRTGSCEVPMRADRLLSRWVHAQRSFYTQGKLSGERQRQLEHTGMPMSLHDISWEGFYLAAALFRQQHGHTGFGRQGGAKGRELMDWKHRQRKLLREGELRPDRHRRMEALGVTLDNSRGDFWEARLAELVAFRAQHGHTNVPNDYADHNTSLGTWVHNQRMLHRKGAMSPARLQRLDSVGFSWSGPMGSRSGPAGVKEGRGANGATVGGVQRRRGRPPSTPRQGKARTPRGRKPRARGGPSSSRSPRSRRSDSGPSVESIRGLGLRPMSPSAEATSSISVAFASENYV